MSITDKFIRDINQYFRYSTDSEPTTQQDFQEAMKNWIKTEEAIVDSHLWQPTTAYRVGNIVKTPSLASQYILECTTAGTSGTEEPSYSGVSVGSVVTDGTARWTVKQYAMGDKYLPLTGGTLQNNNTNSPLILKKAGLTRGTSPSSEANLWLVKALDNSNNWLGGIYKIVSDSNVSSTRMYDYPNNLSSASGHYIGIFHDASGNVYTYAPTPAQTDDSTKIATTAYVKDSVPKSVGSGTKPVYTNSNGVITASGSTVGSATQPVYLNGGAITKCTYTLNKSVPANAVFTDTNNITAHSNATNGYIQFSTGAIIEWGSSSANGGSVTITFPKAFPTACRSCVVIDTVSNSGGVNYGVGLKTLTKTNFSVSKDEGRAIHWIAVGY